MQALYQLVAKGYTEGLSRNPSPQELVATVQALPCTEAAVGNWLQSILLSQEPQVAALNATERTRVAYRLLLNRDAEQAGLNYYTTLPFPQTIRDIRRSPEYRRNILNICKSKTLSYGWGVTPLDSAALDTDLRAQLATAIPGQTVWATGRIAVTTPLVVPPGVTLRSVGAHYAQQAHLFRSGAYTGGVVRLAEGSRLENVVVDGRRTETGYVEQAINIEVMGSGAVVQGVRSINPAGWTALFVSPHYGVVENVSIVGNTIIGYGTTREGAKPGWSDGISFAGHSGDIRNNYVLDMTDVGIIAFDPYNRGTAMIAAYNAIINVGNHSWGAFGVDQSASAQIDFSRTTFGGNLVYTAGTTQYRVGILDGIQTWGGNRKPLARGANYHGNYGYLRIELFGHVTDAGLSDHWQPSISYVGVSAPMKPGCSPLERAVTGLHRTEGCL